MHVVGRRRIGPLVRNGDRGVLLVRQDDLGRVERAVWPPCVVTCGEIVGDLPRDENRELEGHLAPPQPV